MLKRNKLAELESRRIQLVRGIRDCRREKTKLINFVSELNELYSKGRIDYEEKRLRLNETLGEKSLSDWIKYYDDYINYYEAEIAKHDSSGRRVNVLPLAIILLMVVGLGGLFLMDSGITGFFIGENGTNVTVMENVTEVVNVTLIENITEVINITNVTETLVENITEVINITQPEEIIIKENITSEQKIVIPDEIALGDTLVEVPEESPHVKYLKNEEEWDPVGIQKWRNKNTGEYAAMIGGMIINYQDDEGEWKPIEKNWIEVDGEFVSDRSILKARATRDGRVTIDIEWDGERYGMTQSLNSLVLLNKLNNDELYRINKEQLDFSRPTMVGNKIIWEDVVEGVNIELVKGNGQLAYRLVYDPTFISNLLGRAGELNENIVFGNEMEVELRNLDNPNFEGEVYSRVLKELPFKEGRSNYNIEMLAQHLTYSGNYDSSNKAITQDWRKDGEKIYLTEETKLVDVNAMYTKHPERSVYHNSQVDIGITDIEDSAMYANAKNNNYGAAAAMSVWWSPTRIAIIRVRNVATNLGAGATITSADLSVAANWDTGIQAISAQRVFKPWVEGDEDGINNDDGDITWNDWASDANEWGTAGAQCEGDDGSDNSADGGGCTSSTRDTKATVESYVNIYVDAFYNYSMSLDLAQGWYDGTYNEEGVLLEEMNSSGGGAVNFQTEAATEAYRPYWVFIYTTNSAPNDPTNVVINSTEVVQMNYTTEDLRLNFYCDDPDTSDTLIYYVTVYNDTGQFDMSSSCSDPEYVSVLLDKANTTKYENISFSVNVSDDSGDYSATVSTIVNVTIANSNASITTPAFNQTTYNSNSNINVSLIFSDDDGDNNDITFEWFNDSGLIQRTTHSGLTNGTNSSDMLSLENVIAYTNITVQAFAFDGDDNSTLKNSTTVQITSSNSAPNDPTVSISSISGLDLASEDLNCEFTPTDPDAAETLLADIVWLKENITNFTLPSVSVTQDSLYVSVLQSENTSQYENWSCEVQICDDESACSAWVNSSQLMIQFTDVLTPNLTWEAPTPNNGSTISYNDVYLNTTINDESNTSSFFDWNYTLISYWSFDSYNNTVVFDNSSYGKNAIFESGSDSSNISISGKYGSSFEGNGNINLRVDYDPIYDLQEGFTIDTWINAHSIVGDDHQVIISKQDFASGSTDRNFWLDLWTDGTIHLRFSSVVINPDCDAATTTDLRGAGWKHIVSTWNGSDCSIFVDGILGANDATGGTPQGVGDDIYIGREGHETNIRYFNGSIDELKIYSRAISSEEINASFNSGSWRLHHNFTNLTNGVYDYNAYIIDERGNMNITSIRQVNISVNTNNPPNDPIDAVLNSTLGTNLTLQFLRVGFTPTDPDAEGTLTYDAYLFENGTNTYTLLDQSTTQDKFEMITVLRNLTTKGYNYTVQLRVCDDDSACSNYVNTSGLTVLNTPPEINNISINDNWAITVSGNTSVFFSFIATDNDNYTDLDVTTILSNITNKNDDSYFRSNNTAFDGGCVLENTFTDQTGQSATMANYSCTVNFVYYDPSGEWYVRTYIEDSEDSAQNNTKTISLGQTTSFSLQTSSVAFPSSVPLDTNITQTAGIYLNNTGNDPIAAGDINITATRVHGDSDGSTFIPTTNFTISTLFGINSCDISDTTNVFRLTNKTNVGTTTFNSTIISSASLPTGIAGSNEETLFLCLLQVPGDLTTQTYSTDSEEDWAVIIN